jgi:hypothetical protein
LAQSAAAERQHCVARFVRQSLVPAAVRVQRDVGVDGRVQANVPVGEGRLHQHLDVPAGLDVDSRRGGGRQDARRSEFPLLASASERYGRQVAFLGVDTSDEAGPARSLLTGHAVSYPSYQSSSAQVARLGGH